MVLLCDIKLFHIVSQCFFVLCVTLCRTLWYSVTLNYSAVFLYYSTVSHSVFTVSHSVFSYSVILCDINFFFCSTVFHSVFMVFFRTLCYSVSYSVVLCGINIFRSVSFLFRSDSFFVFCDIITITICHPPGPCSKTL
jgi:hypothetical protein